MSIKRNKLRAGGFSLTEMLIATGIMAIGLVLVATIFPVGVKLTTMTAERSIAAVTADEAFAKIRLYGLQDASVWPTASNPQTACSDYMFTANFDYDDDGDIDIDDALDVDWDEFYYPSDPEATDTKYCWSALCRRIDSQNVQMTVFVNRMTFGGVSYYGLDYDGTNYGWLNTNQWPTPIRINVEYDPTDTSTLTYLRELTLDMGGADNTEWDSLKANSVYSFLDEGFTIVSDRSGKIYSIEELQDTDGDNFRETIILREDWQWNGYESDPLTLPVAIQSESIWLVPPGVGSSRYPCVGVFQKVLRLE